MSLFGGILLILLGGFALYIGFVCGGIHNVYDLPNRMNIFIICGAFSIVWGIILAFFSKNDSHDDDEEGKSATKKDSTKDDDAGG